jgi:hypothetical protein
MPKKIMRPDRLCSATAVVRHPFSNGLVGAEACLPECLRFTQSPKNENLSIKSSGIAAFMVFSRFMIYVIIEVYQQYHKSTIVFSQAIDMI